MTTSVKNVLR